MLIFIVNKMMRMLFNDVNIINLIEEFEMT